MMRRFVTYKSLAILLLVIGSSFHGCTEPFSPEIPNSESILVVEAALTNELKNHEIFLSRSTNGLETPETESNANVRIVDDSQREYVFVEAESGRYISDLAFAAQPNTDYRLLITLSNGRSYTSTPVALPQTTQLTEVYAERTTGSSGLEGVGIYVNSFDPTGNSTYYKYEYEETYKVVVPEWNAFEFVLVSDNRVDVRQRTEEKRTCYATDSSNTLVLTQTSGIGEDRVSGFNVRFLGINNFIISHRYSILVKQYVLSREAYDFYKKLQEFSGSESLFSQSQPGFITGNIFPEDNEDEKVVGIFEISSVSEKRTFFNYTDFFPNAELPPFIDECQRTTLAPDGVLVGVKADRISFVDFDPIDDTLTIVQPKLCGDCTAFGPEEAPDFWEE